MSFDHFGLSTAIVNTLTELGYKSPSPIQTKAIPAVMSGRDVMAEAQTGTGKTASFALPLLELLSGGQRARANQVRALILTPTRELAAQVGESVASYGGLLSLRSVVVFGGVKINPQMMNLRRGADILVATPGRLLDLYQQNAVKFTSLEVVVLDEADRMLDMGFIRDIKKILAVLPKKRQNLLFSATFSDDIRKLAKGFVNRPIEISVTPPNSTAKRVKQWIYPVDKKRKPALLTQLIQDNAWRQVLVFTKTKHGANRLVRFLEEKGLNAAAIHGNKSQAARTRALKAFKLGEIAVLVATDIAARGLDIDQLPQVVNFDLPTVAEDYVHRIGRTGRAGASGQAISLVSADEIKQLHDIERLIKTQLERKILDGYEPVHDLPESQRLPHRPRKGASSKKKTEDPSSRSKRQGAKSSDNTGNKKRRDKEGERNASSSTASRAKASGHGEERKKGAQRVGKRKTSQSKPFKKSKRAPKT